MREFNMIHQLFNIDNLKNSCAFNSVSRDIAYYMYELKFEHPTSLHLKCVSSNH